MGSVRIRPAHDRGFQRLSYPATRHRCTCYITEGLGPGSLQLVLLFCIIGGRHSSSARSRKGTDDRLVKHRVTDLEPNTAAYERLSKRSILLEDAGRYSTDQKASNGRSERQKWIYGRKRPCLRKSRYLDPSHARNGVSAD